MSYQPDEFTTFAALSQMKPGRGDLDPRTYKYGGLWTYPVGVLLKVASFVGLVRLTPDSAYYLDHPEAFGRFYVVARLYSACWGILGVIAVFLIVRRICGSDTAAFCAALCFMLMPVVMTAAHEAKPHLAGTTLTLLAVLCGARFVELGRRSLAIATALLCGAAIGMVPSALPVLLLLPAMVIFRNRLPATTSTWHGRPRPCSAEGGGESEMISTSDRTRPGWLCQAGLDLASVKRVASLLLLAAFVYCLTNPYVPINLIRDRAVLRSNFGNSSDFYHAGWSGLPRAMLLIGLGGSFVLATMGMIGAVALALRARRTALASPQELRRRTTGLLLAAVTLPVGMAFVIFASGQPADYARFALPFDAFLAIEAIVAVETFVSSRRWRAVVFSMLVATTGFMGLQYLVGFERDTRPETSRTMAAARLADLLHKEEATLATLQEPAPWSLPPVDLYRWRIVLTPRGWPGDRPFPGAIATVSPADFPTNSSLAHWVFGTPISWADKSFRIQTDSTQRLLPWVDRLGRRNSRRELTRRNS